MLLVVNSPIPVIGGANLSWRHLFRGCNGNRSSTHSCSWVSFGIWYPQEDRSLLCVKRRQRLDSGAVRTTRFLRRRLAQKSPARSGEHGIRVRCEGPQSNFTNDMDDREKDQSVQLYGRIERVISDTARRTQGTAGDAGRWEDFQGVWVIRPTYLSPLLERLSERGFIIVATPFASGFDHLRIADEVQFKFDRCMRSIRDDFVESLPVFGVGHSFGSLALLLVGARYAVQRQGNILMSFNNKEASKAIPLFSPVIIPMAQNFAPLIAQLTTSPAIRLGADFALKQLQSLSPPLVKQILPLVEQLPPLYADLAGGKDNFTPTPEETSKLVKSYYGVGRNLLVKFRDDTIDETPDLARMLSFDSAVSGYLDMSVRTLPGDHTRPLQQVLPQVPPGMMDAFTRGSELLGNLGAFAANTPFANVAKEMGQSFPEFPEARSMKTRAQVTEDIENLVSDLASWMYDSMR
ncbi:unnamed protein product [Calypogeia fissa]